MNYIENLSINKVIFFGAIFSIIIELITVYFRFVLKMESTRDTVFLSKLTFGLRIHHGYIGLLIIFGAVLFQDKFKNLFLIIGISLFVSDMIHHFLVLWPVTGSPQFDFFYPKDK